jgi:hypothetical protein
MLSGLCSPVEGFWSWSTLKKIKVYYVTDFVGEGVIKSVVYRRRPCTGYDGDVSEHIGVAKCEVKCNKERQSYLIVDVSRRFIPK